MKRFLKKLWLALTKPKKTKKNSRRIGVHIYEKDRPRGNAPTSRPINIPLTAPPVPPRHLQPEASTDRWIIIRFDTNGRMAIDQSSVTDVYTTALTKEVLQVLAIKDTANQYIALPISSMKQIHSFILKDKYVN